MAVAHRAAVEDHQLRALRAELLAAFPVRPELYWLDLVATSSIAWGAAAVAVVGPPVAIIPALVVAALATLRAAYFIHELAHVRRKLPGFELAWTVLVGSWVLLPSFMGDAHVDHHRLATYGTQRDPEYERVGGWSRARLVLSIAMMPIVPVLLVARWSVIGPLSWLVPPLRRLAWARMSTLQTNPRYVRALGDPYATRTVALELAATLAVVGAAVLLARGDLPARAAWAWWAITSIALVLNQARTLLAHAYASPGTALTLAEQVADTATSVRASVTFVLGTQYHALHHLAPQLPYHALAAAHAHLVERGAPSAYAHTIVPGFARGLAERYRRPAAGGL